MIIAAPTYAIADRLPVRFTVINGKPTAQYLNLAEGLWVENFKVVYNILMGCDADDPREFFKGDLVRMDRRNFEDRVKALLEERKKRLGLAI